MGNGRSDKNKRNWGGYNQSTSNVPYYQAPRYGARSGYRSSKLGLEEKEDFSVYNFAGLFLSPLESLKHPARIWRERCLGYRHFHEITASLVERHCWMSSCETAFIITGLLIPLMLIIAALFPIIIIVPQGIFNLVNSALGIRRYFLITQGAVITTAVLSGICVAGALLAAILTVILAPRAINRHNNKIAAVLGFESVHEICRVLDSHNERDVLRIINVSNCLKLYEVAYVRMHTGEIMTGALDVLMKLAEETLKKHGFFATQVTADSKHFLCDGEGNLLRYSELVGDPKYKALFDEYLSMIDQARKFMRANEEEDLEDILNLDRKGMNDGARIMVECMERACSAKGRHQFSSDRPEKDSNILAEDDEKSKGNWVRHEQSKSNEPQKRCCSHGRFYRMTNSLVERHCEASGYRVTFIIAISLTLTLLIFAAALAVAFGIAQVIAVSVFAFYMVPFSNPPKLVAAFAIVLGVCIAGALLATILIVALIPGAIYRHRNKMAEVLGFDSVREMYRVLDSYDKEDVLRITNINNCLKLYDFVFRCIDSKRVKIDYIMERAPGVIMKIAEEALRKHGFLATELEADSERFLCDDRGVLLKYRKLKKNPEYKELFDTYSSMVDQAYKFMHEHRKEGLDDILFSDREDIGDGARIMMECMERARPTKDGHQFSSVESSTLTHVDKETIHKPFGESEKDSNVSEKD